MHNAGQPETPTTQVTNQDLMTALLASQEREQKLLKEMASIKRNMEALSSSVIYFAVKRKNLLAKIGHTDDWERRRKEHERNGWDIQGWQCEPKATEKPFIWVLKTHGVEPVGGTGFREVYPLNEAFLQTARNFGWPLGVYTNPTIWRRSSRYSKPGRDSGQKHLFNGAA